MICGYCGADVSPDWHEAWHCREYLRAALTAAEKENARLRAERDEAREMLAEAERHKSTMSKLDELGDRLADVARASALEEAAAECEAVYVENVWPELRSAASECARRIRALKGER